MRQRLDIAYDAYMNNIKLPLSLARCVHQLSGPLLRYGRVLLQAGCRVPWLQGYEGHQHEGHEHELVCCAAEAFTVDMTN